ncbi:MAG: adenylosuccinate synthetase, partial [Alphaproteobacteria bacterium]|nr:adenylosuccinate synthetase [Alphaproteobacteria bacterium]
NALMYHNALLKGLGAAPLDADELEKSLIEVAPKITPYAGSSWQALDAARNDNKKVLFEGAQGIMLDVDHGTYPFVTSSNTVAANAASGTGARQAGTVLGITKAYTTRVGSGPFPTELNDDIGETLGQRGHEFGTTTGRKRRCGWFDAVQVRQAVKTGGLDHLVLTKLDVMDTLEEVKICIAYEARGKRYDYLPAASDLQAEVRPVYETMPGWQASIKGVRRFEDLPAMAVKYVRRLEELTGATAAAISTSPEREDTILVKKLF